MIRHESVEILTGTSGTKSELPPSSSGNESSRMSSIFDVDLKRPAQFESKDVKIYEAVEAKDKQKK